MRNSCQCPLLSWSNSRLQSTNIQVKDLVTYRLATQDTEFLIDEGVRGTGTVTLGLLGTSIANSHQLDFMDPGS